MILELQLKFKRLLFIAFIFSSCSSDQFVGDKNSRLGDPEKPENSDSQVSPPPTNEAVESQPELPADKSGQNNAPPSGENQIMSNASQNQSTDDNIVPPAMVSGAFLFCSEENNAGNCRVQNEEGEKLDFSAYEKEISWEFLVYDGKSWETDSVNFEFSPSKSPDWDMYFKVKDKIKYYIVKMTLGKADFTWASKQVLYKSENMVLFFPDIIGDSVDSSLKSDASNISDYRSNTKNWTVEFYLTLANSYCYYPVGEQDYYEADGYLHFMIKARRILASTKLIYFEKGALNKELENAIIKESSMYHCD